MTDQELSNWDESRKQVKATAKLICGADSDVTGGFSENGFNVAPSSADPRKVVISVNQAVSPKTAAQIYKLLNG